MEERKMKNVRVKNNIFVVARKSPKGKKLDYFIQLPNKEENYMFTRNYSAKCYEVCKAGVPINSLLGKRKKNPAIMRLVKYLNYMMPYFVEYYELEVAA